LVPSFVAGLAANLLAPRAPDAARADAEGSGAQQQLARSSGSAAVPGGSRKRPSGGWEVERVRTGKPTTGAQRGGIRTVLVR
jgi:hypothetical protein